ncbi:hypothetical protein [Comamonas squillarum]|uniref:Tail fiber protein n=1 Tax=Comamonas squillarum TaxID=2977320 RepID=A0ABY6A173_9BURK|nr:hypothetical protein [Comamonas sp. PR12]UXC20002.1 hypothetical protein N4T19_07815 [Comamonas sp. PR12]
MDEATFNVTAENFTTQMAPWGGDVKAVAESAKTNAEYSNQRANDSNTSAETAAARLVDVQTAANGAFAAANYKGEWSTLTGALNVPATVTHLGRLWYLKLNLANVTTQAPALGSTYWGEVSRNDFTVYACPAGTTIAADRGMYRMSSGSSVLQLPANPFHGMVVAAVNVSGTLTPYIQRNGKTICGDAEDYVMNVLNWQIALQFDSASNDWVRINGVTAYTAAQPAIASANTWTALQNFTGGLNMNGNAVVARGINANGEYVRFGDGTQICWRASGTSTIASAAGSLFVNGSSLGPLDWPVPFSAPPQEVFTGQKLDGTAGHCWAAATSRGTATQTGSFQLFRATSSTDGFYAQIMGVGRWF